MADEQHYDVLEALRRPEAYVHEDVALSGPIEVVETHVSQLFFTDSHVYKIKKPVDVGFADFTTLEKRRANSERELALNGRFSPSVYLGVLPVTQRDGLVEINGDGEVVDYVLKMRRLPHERMLEALLVEGEVTEEDVRRVARRVAEFHAGAETSDEIRRVGGTDALSRLVEENFAQTEGYVGRLVSRAVFDDVAAYSRAFFRERGRLLHEREAAGRVRDGHGDLHAAHVCLENGIDFIDCLEFSAEYRYGDTALDLGFLAMDLDHYRRRELAAVLVDAYIGASGDDGARAVLDFFKCYRAYVRAKVTSMRLDNAELDAGGREATAGEATAYYGQAHGYATAVLPERSLFVVMGLPGTGKSTLATRLAEHWGLRLVSSDVERKRLAGLDATEHRYEAFGTGLHTAEHDDATYDSLVRRSLEQLAQGSVIVDASLTQPRYRERLIAAAGEAGVEAWLVECEAPPEVVRARITARIAAGTDPSDATTEIYDRRLAERVPVTEVGPERHVRVETDAAPAEVLSRALQGLFAAALAADGG